MTWIITAMIRRSEKKKKVKFSDILAIICYICGENLKHIFNHKFRIVGVARRC